MILLYREKKNSPQISPLSINYYSFAPPSLFLAYIKIYYCVCTYIYSCFLLRSPAGPGDPVPSCKHFLRYILYIEYYFVDITR